jgi:hypothetical protein
MTTLIMPQVGALGERRFFTGMALAILATVLVGFSRSFFLRPLYPEWQSPSEPIFYVHGMVFTAWIVLFVVQTALVASGHTELHRKIGPALNLFGGEQQVVRTDRGPNCVVVGDDHYGHGLRNGFENLVDFSL